MITLLMATLIIVVPPAKANSGPISLEPTVAIVQVYRQGRWNRGRRWNNNRRVRVVTHTRLRWIGGRLFRETVRVTYLPNGRVMTQVIRRVRIR